ncbi:SDR family NAD(P)-dependent oxidoreductase [Nocardia higoensis]|uniref:SDR family NAD(P)-dependent oxidoreductase n=1 Tax=Nocardia higoensis TaxID=228599 RepID=UPI00031831C8|nr:SDR family NAD(P)-dependent oxidoreductase [Nocardia higoensis]
MTRTWFITGANRGLGRAFTLAVLGAGDRVVATARDPRTMADLHDSRLTTLPLDVRDHAAVAATVDEAVARTGGVDVVVNNAGFGLVGAVEELAEADWREQMEVNFFGALWVSQAFAPHLRERGSGHIVQISTVGAVGSLPLFGAYNASKWALEGFSAALADELRPFGVHVTLAQLGGFDTDWAKSSMRFGVALPAYQLFRENILGMPDYPDPHATGAGTPGPAESADPESTGTKPAAAQPKATEPAGSEPASERPGEAEQAGAAATEADEWSDAPPEVAAQGLLALVNMPNPPLRRVIGPTAHRMVTMALEQRRVDYLTDPEFVWPA